MMLNMNMCRMLYDLVMKLYGFGKCFRTAELRSNISQLKGITTGPNHNTYRREFQATLTPPLDQFKKHIEADPCLLQLFRQAFQEIPNQEPYTPDQGGHGHIHDYLSMITAIDKVVKTSPSWTADSNHIIACPMNDIVVWLANTLSGSLLFQRADVNRHICQILDFWAQHLASPDSRYVLDNSPTSWLSIEGIERLVDAVNIAHNNPSPEIKSFGDAFICDPGVPYYGFKSWDDFFTRRFRSGVRPVAYPHDADVVTSACESCPMHFEQGVAMHATFDIKQQTYSLIEMLDYDSLAKFFAEGTVYQAFLDGLSYHRWHAPISGTVVKTLHVPGTYYAAHPSEGFLKQSPYTGDFDPDSAAPDRSQKFLTSVATRSIIFIEADNTKIGLMAFVGVGMGEISSCATTVQAGQRVEKGEEIGSFHYGGSTNCLVFGKHVKLVLEENVRQSVGAGWSDTRNLAVRSSLGRVV